MTTKNPFPGMNPFFEQQWRDAHKRLLTYLHDALQENLPADLIARTEEEVVTVGAGGSPTTYRPDVQVPEPWTLKEPAVAAPATKPPAITTTKPVRVLLDEEIDRWIEIRDATGRLLWNLYLSGRATRGTRGVSLALARAFAGSFPIHRSRPRMPPGWMRSFGTSICVEPHCCSCAFRINPQPFRISLHGHLPGGQRQAA